MNDIPWYKKAVNQKRMFILLTIGPALIFYTGFILWPNALSVVYSLWRWDGISDPVYIGLDNYKYMLSDPFILKSLLNNIVLMLAIPLLVILISLLLAYLLINKGYRENSFYKVIFFFPNVLSTVVIALMWVFIYDGNFGLINTVLQQLGIDVGNHYWLGDTRTALAAIIPPYVWAGVGFYIIIFMNAMKGIPSSLYESAILEGASSMQQLFKITIPLISGIIRIGILFLVLGQLKGFEMILVLTGGGPAGSTNVIGLYLFQWAFGGSTTGSFTNNYGYASAIGMLLFVVLIAAQLLINKFFKKEAVEY